MGGASFYEKPILNSPYLEPVQHHNLSDDGQPLDTPPAQGRRRSELISPIPKARKQKKRKTADQTELELHAGDGLSSEFQEYNPTPIINEIRAHVKSWREIPNPNDWGVSPATQRLLSHWRSHEFEGIRPFFCQVEAVETIIWLTEVARKQGRYKQYWEHIRGANELANPELIRLAMKMATGAGKTTVMAMLIAWQVVNAVRFGGASQFTRGFLIVAPGITIRDRLRVLLPSDPDNYYRTRELVPADMLNDLGSAKIVITNYHAFQPRVREEEKNLNKVNRGLRQGRGPALNITETEGEMIHRVAKELMGLKNIVVINDEAHHCYREKPDNTQIDELKGDDKNDAKDENEAARVWISGLEAFKRKLGVRAVFDLSATPFFLSGSGYAEGTLFPWTISDFSLMDAIECGIVKLPRIPVADNIPDADVPIFRELWKHIGKKMPKARSAKDFDPEDLPDQLQTALYALYEHYSRESELWKRQGIDIPPVFIVVCNNTASSKLVYEWISGWQREDEDGEPGEVKAGKLELFRNYDEYGNRLPRPNALLIDSAQFESGKKLDDNYLKAVAKEIEQFKREMRQRGDGAKAAAIKDEDLLREVMNTVGKKGRLGESIRCVVSVSMLTEGWDANNVTHVLGARAFGTQLLCEQVVGRGLRRYSYDLNEENLFDAEYSNILGIPFNFAGKPVVSPPQPPKNYTRVAAVPEREALEIEFPRVSGYRIELPHEKLRAEFSKDSTLTLTPEMVGPGETLLEGIVGEGVTLSPAEAKDLRPSTVIMHLAKHLLNRFFKDDNGDPKLHLFNQIHRIARQWVEGGHFVCKGGTAPWMIHYASVGNQAAERIYNAIAATIGDTEQIKAVLDPYNPTGSSSHVGFNTTKDTYTTDPRRCHINAVVSDSEWEAEFARVAEAHPKVIAYVKNQGLNFEIPYMDGSVPRKYIPDFIVRLDDGRGVDDPLNLIVEVKGYRDENVKLKSETTKNQWVPGVNNLGTYGRWAFEEMGDVFEFANGLNDLLNRLTGETVE